MKKIKKLYIVFVVAGVMIAGSSCKKSLDLSPLNAISPGNFFKNENDLRLYANGFYNNGFYMNSSVGGGTINYQGYIADADDGDNLVPRSSNAFLAGNYVVPNSDGNWSFTTIRNLNYFITHYSTADVSDSIKNQYLAEIRLFRAYDYWRKAIRYGDVPWLGKDLTETSEELYNPRTPRKVVMDSVLNDLNFAVQYLPAKANAEVDRVNKDVANALKARICLWEGTYRKYNALGDETSYLQAAADAALAVINTNNYKIYSTGNTDIDYRNLFIQEDLGANSESILARKFVKDVSMQNSTRIVSDNNPGFSKNFVTNILCKDGLPISLSPLYKGDDTPDDESTDRDPRYKQLIMTRGFVVTMNANGTPADVITLPRIPSCPTGYAMSKFRSPDPTQINANQSTLDLFLFRYAETLLIYAEAMAELGQANQSVIDLTINKIRDRVGMTHMVIAALQKDPNSDFPTVPVLIDEIRRERRVELAGDLLRYDDLLRWHAGKQFDKPETILGMKLTPALRAQYTTDVSNVVVDANNYVRTYTNITNRTWQDKMYLFPVPLGEITINPNLAPQNTGW